MTQSSPLIAGLELGGTKALALIAREDTVVASARIPTRGPAETLAALSDQLDRWGDQHGEIAALGIASFGPLGLDRRRADYGRITQTTKPGWSDTPVLDHFRSGFSAPIGFDTDVAGAGLAECRWGAGVGQEVVVYITIGTGIGGGLIVHGRPAHGVIHPEMGHVRVRRAAGDAFAGVCPFHGDCIEGLASGPAIAARAGAAVEALGPDHPIWLRVADELGEFLTTLIVVLSPNRILVGGGVTGGKPFLLDRVRAAVLGKLNGYVAGLDAQNLADCVRAPALGDQAGPLGAIALGLDALAAQLPSEARRSGYSLSDDT